MDYTLAEGPVRVLAVITTIALIAGARTAQAQGRHIGVKMGPNVAVLALEEDDAADEYRRRVAVAVAGFAVLPVNRTLAIQFEGLFSPKGAKLDSPLLGATSTLLLDYVEFPVLARVRGPRLRSFHFFAGPYTAVRVSAKRQIASSGGGFTSGIREDMSAEVERFDAGVVAGGGIHIRRRLVIDARYSWGLRTVNRDTTDGIRFKHRVLTIMAGLRFL